MKKRCLFLATLLFVFAAISVAVVSCKKETQNAPLKPTESFQAFNPLEIEDMNAYLKDFKTKMQSATKSDDETLSIEEAAWHISSLANYEFANVNIESNDIRFDTLFAHVNITNGTVLLSDLTAAYQTVSSSIEKFYNSLALDNKHFRFIDAIISENGEVTIPLLTTFCHDSKYLINHTWYFMDEWDAAYACDTLFPSTNVYEPSTTGLTTLQYKLNLAFSYPYYSNFLIPPTLPVYYTYSSEKIFDHEHYTDPYGSDFNNSRLFNHSFPFLYDLESYGMCYLYDSYLGLGIDNCPTGKEIVSWEVTYKTSPIINPTKEFHELKVIYGIRHESPIPSHDDDD